MGLALPTKVSSIPKLGDHNKDVLALQTALENAGFTTGPKDGIFGKQTAAAVSKFQKSVKLAGSGVIGPKTLNFLGLEVVAINPVTGKKAITQNLKNKNAEREIHPAMRLTIEGFVFPDGKIPSHWKTLDIQAMGNDVADALLAMKIVEVGGNNKGKQVGEIQGVIGVDLELGTGDAWCMSTMQVLVAFVEDFVGEESPVPAMENCFYVHDGAKKIEGLTTTSCEVATMFIGRHGKTTKGHTGWVRSIPKKDKMGTIEGNTGDASARDGDGLYAKVRDQSKIGSMAIIGFVRIYPYNKA